MTKIHQYERSMRCFLPQPDRRGKRLGDFVMNLK